MQDEILACWICKVYLSIVKSEPGTNHFCRCSQHFVCIGDVFCNCATNFRSQFEIVSAVLNALLKGTNQVAQLQSHIIESGCQCTYLIGGLYFCLGAQIA